MAYAARADPMVDCLQRSGCVCFCTIGLADAGSRTTACGVDFERHVYSRFGRFYRRNLVRRGFALARLGRGRVDGGGDSFGFVAGAASGRSLGAYHLSTRSIWRGLGLV